MKLESEFRECIKGEHAGDFSRERTQKAAPRVADPGEVAGSGHGAGAAVEAVGKAWGPSYSVSTAAQGISLRIFQFFCEPHSQRLSCSL